MTVRSSGWIATALTVVKVSLVVFIALGAFTLAAGSVENFSMNGAAGTCEGVPESAKLGLGGFGAAMLGALWGYNGWAILAAVGGEIRNPAHTVPRALIGGTLLVIVLYLFINTAYFYVLTPLEVASVSESSSVASAAASQFFGPGVAALMAVGLAISAYGTTHTTMLSGHDLAGGRLPPLAVQLLPVLVIVFATAVNLMTVRSSGWIATALTVVKVSLVVFIALGAFTLAAGSVENFSMNGAAGTCEGVPESAKLGLGGFGAAMLGALWGYNGWAILAAVGGEIRNPAHTVPRALIGGTLLVIVLYLFINTAYFYVLTPLEVASVPESSSVASAAASRMHPMR